MQDQRGPYFSALEASDRPRAYWAGPSPEDPAEWWYFETVEDGGEIVAIRQVTVEADGVRRKYSADHLEDEWGFLTDQPLKPDEFEGLRRCSPERFVVTWDGTVVHCPRCGDGLIPIGPTLGCLRGRMELSEVMESALITIARSAPVIPERRFESFRVGGTWHCPADGQGMVEAEGLIRCGACGRCLPPNVIYHLVELHVHEK